MSIFRYPTTLDSIKFLIKLPQIIKQPFVCTNYNHNGCSANFYSSSEHKKKGLVVIFHGLNQMGNSDPRLQSLVHSLTSISYDCLIPQITPSVEIRAPIQSDFDVIADFLNYLFTHKIDTRENLLFIGPSSSCLYMIKIESNPFLKHPVKSMCFISPYFSPLISLREILETPRLFYSQLVTLKLVLHSENELQIQETSKQEFLMFNRAIVHCFEHSEDINIVSIILNFIARESPKSKRLISLVEKLGKPGFITDELLPSFIDVTNKSAYDEVLDQIKSKMTLIHGYTDPIFSPNNSKELATALNQRDIINKLIITKMLDHANLVSSQMLKESIPIIKALNHFFL